MEVQTFTESQPAPAETPIVETPKAPDDPSRSTMSDVRAAAQRLAARRKEKAAEAAAAPAVTESPPQEVEAAPEPVEVQPSGETQAPDPVVEELPSIEPPRSWTADDKETFKALPRETQARLVEIDRAREIEVRRVQNEVAEQRKAGDAERTAMEQARQQYESALPVLLQTLQSSAEFADIKTIDDVTALAANDWPRYVQWDAHQKKLTAVYQEMQTAYQRQEQEQSEQWGQFASKEDQLFAEQFPDATALREPAINYLKNVGFKDNEIAENWNQKLWRDHRMQRIIMDAVKFQNAQKAKAEAIKTPVPPVQRPGVAQAKSNPHAAQIKALEQKPSLTIKEAAQLNQLRRSAAS